MIVAGFGFTSRATAASLQDAYEKARGADLTAGCMATLGSKAAEACIVEFRSNSGLSLVAVDHEAAQATKTPTRSPSSQAAHGIGSVAEATALVAAGQGARLLRARQVSDDRQATCALAEGVAP